VSLWPTGPFGQPEACPAWLILLAGAAIDEAELATLRAMAERGWTRRSPSRPPAVRMGKANSVGLATLAGFLAAISFKLLGQRFCRRPCVPRPSGRQGAARHRRAVTCSTARSRRDLPCQSIESACPEIAQGVVCGKTSDRNRKPTRPKDPTRGRRRQDLRPEPQAYAAEGPNSREARVYPSGNVRRMIWILRFFARPSAVSLVVTGTCSPLLLAVMRVGSTPSRSRNLALR
jgi:hypothetical protein